MRYKNLGSTDISASVLGFGGIPIQRVSTETAVEILAECKAHGINFIDTARMYTDSEDKIGAYFRAHGRQGWYVATKSPARDYAGMQKDINISLGKMGCDYIDLYQLHNVGTLADLQRALQADGAMAALEEARTKGLVRHIGITGHKPEVLEAAVDTGRFATIQIPFSALEQQGIAVMKKAREKGMGVIAMKPLAGGALTAAAAALDFIFNSPWVDVAIPGMDAVEQVRENCSVLEKGATPEQKRELDELIASLGSQFCRRCEYCQPCPAGLKIPSMFLFEGYYTRYNLREWALERYVSLPVKASECTQCGVCETRCPYELPIREMLKQVAATMEK